MSSPPPPVFFFNFVPLGAHACVCVCVCNSLPGCLASAHYHISFSPLPVCPISSPDCFCWMDDCVKHQTWRGGGGGGADMITLQLKVWTDWNILTIDSFRWILKTCVIDFLSSLESKPAKLQGFPIRPSANWQILVGYQIFKVEWLLPSAPRSLFHFYPLIPNFCFPFLKQPWEISHFPEMASLSPSFLFVSSQKSFYLEMIKKLELLLCFLLLAPSFFSNHIQVIIPASVWISSFILYHCRNVQNPQKRLMQRSYPVFSFVFPKHLSSDFRPGRLTEQSYFPWTQIQSSFLSVIVSLAQWSCCVARMMKRVSAHVSVAMEMSISPNLKV